MRPNDWRRVKVSEVCSLIVDCVNKTAPVVEYRTPFRMIRTTHIGEGRIRLSDEKFVLQETYEKWTRRAKLEIGDVLLTREAPLGEVGYVRDSDTKFLGQRIMQYRADPTKIHPKFLMYSFLSADLQGQFHAHGGTGSTVDHIRVPDCTKFELWLPPLHQQTAIAETLGSIDDKIELNRRMNETLEAMLRALFQSWFVDFDPVRAKLDGRVPVGMGADMAALFPNHLVEGEGVHTPEGWKSRDLDSIADYLNGLALQKYPPDKGATLPAIKIAQLRKGNSEGADLCNSKVPQSYIVDDGDVLFSWSGSLEVELWCGGRGALNQHLFKVTSNDFPKWFYYLWTLHHLEDFRAIAADKATTMGHIQRGHLKSAKVLVPPKSLLDAMTDIVSPLIKQIIANRIQSRTLAATRDTLLPKLLSGSLRTI